MEKTDFINLYIKNLANEVSELSKMKVLLTSKEEFKVTENNELKQKIVELEKEKINIREEVSQTWKSAGEKKEHDFKQKLLEVQKTLEGKNTILANRISELHSTIEEKNKEITNLNKLGAVRKSKKQNI